MKTKEDVYSDMISTGRQVLRAMGEFESAQDGLNHLSEEDRMWVCSEFESSRTYKVLSTILWSE